MVVVERWKHAIRSIWHLPKRIQQEIAQLFREALNNLDVEEEEAEISEGFQSDPPAYQFDLVQQQVPETEFSATSRQHPSDQGNEGKSSSPGGPANNESFATGYNDPAHAGTYALSHPSADDQDGIAAGHTDVPGNTEWPDADLSDGAEYGDASISLDALVDALYGEYADASGDAQISGAAVGQTEYGSNIDEGNDFDGPGADDPGSAWDGSVEGDGWGAGADSGADAGGEGAAGGGDAAGGDAAGGGGDGGGGDGGGGGW